MTHYLRRCQQAVRISAFDSISGTELVSRSLTVDVPAGEEAPVRQLMVQQFSRRGDGEVAFRALVVMQDDSLHMLAPPGEKCFCNGRVI